MSDAPETIPAAHEAIDSAASTSAVGAIKEGFICAGISFLLSTIFTVMLMLWAEHNHPEEAVLSAYEWGQATGLIMRTFVWLGALLSAVVFHRRKKKVTSSILYDWRWWLVFIIIIAVLPMRLAALPGGGVAGWLWIGLVYQARLHMKLKVSESPTTKTSVQ